LKTSQISTMWYTQMAKPWNTALQRADRDSQAGVTDIGRKRAGWLHRRDRG
jgi:hypothetical protein